MLKRIRNFPETNILSALVVMIAIFGLATPAFLSEINVLSVLRTLAFYGIVAVGHTLVMIGGDIDISVGSTAGLGSVLSAHLMMQTNVFGMLGTSNEWLGVILIMILTMIICSLVGVVNATLVVILKIPPFIATISTLYAVRGVVMVISRGLTIFPLPPFFVEFFGRTELRITEAGGFSVAFLLFVFFAVFLEYMLRRSTFGRNLYATGSNREVAELSGINTKRVRFINYMIAAALAALAGMLVASFIGKGYPPTGLGWELWIVAATVIGGISLKGGAGSIIGTVIGVFIMNVLNNGLVMLQINTFLQHSVLGATILVAVYLDIRRRSKKIVS